MKWLERFRYRTFSHTDHVDELLIELFRKSIHLSSAFITVFAERWYTATIAGIIALTAVYCISEQLRMRNVNICCIAKITQYAARPRDKGKFVLGPVTLAVGVLITLLVFPPHTAKIAVFALAFGDGLASLIGKRFGKRHLHVAKDKTFAGSFTCFTAVFISSLAVSRSFWKSLVLAAAAALIEMLPLKDYDNLLIPLAIGVLALAIGA
ncbi:MAG: SEC59/DGK1/VTE5 family protein [Treponema sp.]